MVFSFIVVMSIKVLKILKIFWSEFFEVGMPTRLPTSRYHMHTGIEPATHGFQDHSSTS